MINTTRVRKTNQAWQDNSFNPREYIVENPVRSIESLSEKHKACINYLLEAENKGYQKVYPTQTTLGKAMGCCRQRANVIVGELQELGLISTNYRHMRSCLYKTTSFLRTPFMAQKLGHIFPALQKLLLLLAIGSSDMGATQVILKNYNVLHSSGNFLKKLGIGMGDIQKRVERYCPLPQCLSRQPLTLEQKCTLAAFPEWLIDQAMFKITDMSRIRNLGGYLYNYCMKHCDNPDWKWSAHLKELYKNDPDYEKFPTYIEDQDDESQYSYQKSYNQPKSSYKPKTLSKSSVEPRRSPEGISPRVDTVRIERLYSYEERCERERKFRENTFLPIHIRETLIQKMHQEQKEWYETASLEEKQKYQKEKKEYLERVQYEI